MAARPDEPDDAVPPPDAGAPEPTPDGSAREGRGDDDEQWAAIVAQLGDLAEYDGSEDEEPSPAPEDAPPPDAARPSLSFPVAPWVAEPRVIRPAQDEAMTGRDWDGTSQYDDAEAAVDAEEHFVPPDPGPVLGGDPLLTMAWLAAAGMPIFLLVVVVAWRSAPQALVQAAAVVFVLGVGVLVWRMPHRRDPGDDDSGAVV
ncbi:hypothetical protein Cch01nite_12640 [Cellulomonas chitinilytica]|uniref:Uncharacterized protein n=1 Tax=Cellulomonas chitinilytica TaxID=398759 RepID=A0A919TYF5_9CELL|nr:hypothetical protein [Cellulomonas chitinilytica]GIG20540.1 hypothetical protein Cch01nite_12640 [Cellulomonas chitinilytica]